ncbi:TlpA family protein disulfide reductase [Butyricimonas virosa]|jgi:thioredoxin family protein|nr:TlpA disulfide reductase family protein [Butyricimonas virosa]MCI7390652.1 TlpA family protein disulfide reductase [Butyricimonas virosa]
MGCKSTTTGFEITLLNYPVGENVYLEFDTIKYELTLDSTGKCVILLDRYESGYGVVKCGYMQIPVYIHEGGELKLSFDMKDPVKSLHFDGNLAGENRYLNDSRVRVPKRADQLDEQAFIQWENNYLEERYRFLDSLRLDARFVRIERQRLYALHELALCYYLMMHRYQIDNYKPSEEYLTYLLGVIREDSTLLNLQEYRDAMALLIKTLSTQNVDPADLLLMTKTQLEWIDKYLKDDKVGEFFVYQLVMAYVGEKGIDYFSEISPIYERWVKSDHYRKVFADLYARWDKIAKGRKVPEIEFRDVEGQVVKLTNFKGKYIYIDVWGSTCPPCRKELPFLKILEKDFAGKNIHFLSVSTDRSKQAWIKAIQEEKLDGHLFVPRDLKKFREVFQIRLIPRFILLDQELNIITANMTAPSDSETKKRLNQLEGI